MSRQSKRTFHKTTIEVEILSEDPVDFSNLAEVHAAITDGECSGCFTVTGRKAITAKQAAKALLLQGSEPEFFRITKDGREMDE